MECSSLLMFSSLPNEILGLPFVSSLSEATNTLALLVPRAMLIPLGLKTPEVRCSPSSKSS